MDFAHLEIRQYKMVNACTPQREPILGTGGEKKYVHWFRIKFQIALTSGKKCRSLQKVHSSDDGISLPLAMVPNFCIDKKLGVDSLRLLRLKKERGKKKIKIVPSVRSPSQGSVSDRWIPSKNFSHQAMFR